MPRKRERKTNRGRCPPERAREAVAAVEGGRKIREVAKEYEMCHVTLSRYVKQHKEGADIRVGYNPATRVFSPGDEDALVTYLLKAADCFFGLSPTEVRVLAYQCAIARGMKVPNSWTETRRARVEWFTSFLKRHPQLSIRRPQPTSLARATSFNRENVRSFFEKLRTVMERHMLDPSMIWNLDETGCTTVSEPPAVVAGKGVKQVGGITSGERGQLVTMCSAVSATGNTVPPMFVLPRVRYHAWFIRGGPVGCIGSANKSGWMTADDFVLYLEHFIQHVRPTPEAPVLLLLDNHTSHLSVEALDLAKNSGVVMLSFPPHCSHRLQPLDRSVFGPFKKSFSVHMDGWMRSHPGRPVTIYDIPAIAAEAWVSASTAYFVFQLQAVVIFTQYKDFFRVSLISLCLKIFRGVARSSRNLVDTTLAHIVR